MNRPLGLQTLNPPNWNTKKTKQNGIIIKVAFLEECCHGGTMRIFLMLGSSTWRRIQDQCGTTITNDNVSSNNMLSNCTKYMTLIPIFVCIMPEWGTCATCGSNLACQGSKFGPQGHFPHRHSWCQLWGGLWCDFKGMTGNLKWAPESSSAWEKGVRIPLVKFFHCFCVNHIELFIISSGNFSINKYIAYKWRFRLG